MGRQLVDPIGSLGIVETVRALCGVQAQVPSWADLGLALRRQAHQPGEVRQALAERRLIRTWAMRGTLHLLDPGDAGAYLALVASARRWERPAWQRAFGVTPAQMQELAEAAGEALRGRVLEREELIEEIAARTGKRDLEAQLRSGWGAVLKPLAWMGQLCNGPSRGGRVTFTHPETWLPSWGGLPTTGDAAQLVIRAYLRAYGPATMKAFDAWLTRGRSTKAQIRRWLESVEDRLVTVEVDGHEGYARAEDLDELLATRPTQAVRMLAGFDQYLLGPGTGDTSIVPAQRRKQVSRTAGWISPVVLDRGRVAGVWDLDGDLLTVTLFAPPTSPASRLLRSEADRVAAALGRAVRVCVKVDRQESPSDAQP